MAHIISVLTPVKKSGKTTTAINLSTSLAILEKRVLIVDCDPKQEVGHGTSLLVSFNKSLGFYSLMTDRSTISKEILSSAFDCLNILPSGADFSKVDFLFEDSDRDPFKLRNILKSVDDDFDFIIIDTPTDMPNLEKSIILSSDLILIPFDLGYKSPKELRSRLTELQKFFFKVLSLADQFKVDPRLAGILLNKCDQLVDLSGRMTTDILQSIDGYLLNSRIPERQEISDAFKLGKPVAVYDVMSNGAMAYNRLAIEMINKVDQNS